MIAHDLGLSQALVSKVLNGIRDRVDPKTYARVWAHALAVGYVAKGMSPRASVEATSVKQVGLVLRSGIRRFSQSNIFNLVQEALCESVSYRGYTTVLLGSEETLDVTSLPPMPGIVVFGQVKPNLLKSLARKGNRLVTINSSFPGICHSIVANDAQAVDLLVEHLADLGHRSFGWLGGTPAYGRQDNRQQLFEEALRSRDLPLPLPHHSITVPSGGERQEGREAMAQLFGAPGPRPTAIVTFNGMMARGALNLALQTGLRVPYDLSLAAIDARPVASEEDPHVTCAGTPPQKLGEAAARLLLESESGPEGAYHDLVLGAQFFPGTTTGQAGR